MGLISGAAGLKKSILDHVPVAKMDNGAETVVRILAAFTEPGKA